MQRFIFIAVFSGLFACTSAPQKIELPAETKEQEAILTPAEPAAPPQIDYSQEQVFAFNDISLAPSAIDTALDTERNEESCLIETHKTHVAMPKEQIARLLKSSLSSKWIKPANIDRPYQCNVELRLSESGCVTEIDIKGCQDNQQLVRSIEIALFRSAPLPELHPSIGDGSLLFEFFAGP
ncbi:MAG: hypothetical protein OEZ43_03175 [Gammaproteobacteria bacterium]|nr:hypothetical protein [Gammaproteobacteria bacterium]